MIIKNTKKIALGFLSMLLISTYFGATAQNSLDSISPDRSVQFINTPYSHPWTASYTGGKWVAKSGNGNQHSTTASMSATVVVPQTAIDGDLCFKYRVSSQSGYDMFYVLLDGIAIDGFASGKSGTIPETEVVVPLTPGQHTIEWQYSKNASTNYGEDAAFVSDVYLKLGYCSRPYNIVLHTASDTSAYITWVGGTETNIEYGPQGFARGTGMADFVTDTFYTIAGGLQPNSYYTIWIQNVCPNGDTSVWVPFTFRTACAPFPLPYTQDFESWTASSSLTTPIDPCWSRSNDYSTSSNYPYVYSYSTYSHSGTKSVYFYTSPGTYNLLVMPQFADSIQNLMVSFWMYASSTSYQMQVGVMSNPDDVSTFVPVAYVNNSTTSACLYHEVALSSYRGQGRYIAFRTYSPSYNYVYIDDVTVDVAPTCRRVTNISISNISTTQATVTWTNVGTGSYIVEYGYPGFPLGSGTRIQTSTVNATLTNLNPSTNYEVYVTSVCNNGRTVSHPQYFRTSCGTIQSVPYIENFEGLSTGVAMSKLPCWKMYNSYSTTSYPSIATQGGSNALRFYLYNSSPSQGNSQYAYLATPPIDTNLLPLRTLQVSFKLLRTSSSYNDEIAIGVMTDSSDIETFDTLTTVRASTYNQWNTFSYSLENYRGNGRFIALKTTTAGSQYYSWPYIDDITIERIETCLKPYNLQVLSSFDPNDIQFSWSSYPSPADSWDIAYGPSGFSPYLDGRRINGVTDTFYTLSGLSLDTTYEIYVRAHCGYNDSSMWCDVPVSLTPGTIIMPQNGDQTHYLCDAMIYDNGGPTGNYTDHNNSVLTIYPMTTDSLINISGQYATETSYDVIYIYDGASATGTPLRTFSGTGNLSVTSTTGPLTIKFTSDVGQTFSGFSLRARCVAPPPCRRPIPSVSNVESNRAMISVISSPANSWIMEFSTTQNFTPGRGAGTTISRGSANFTLNGLQPLTTYYAYIRTDCGGGDTSQWSTQFSFTTPCAPETVLPYRQNFNSLSNNSRIACWKSTGSYPLTRRWHTTTQNMTYFFFERNGNENGVSTVRIANIPTNALRVKFSLFGTDTSTRFSVGLVTNPNDFGTFVPIQTFNTRDEYDWYNYEIPLTGANYPNAYIAFSTTTPGGESTETYFDNLVIDTQATCLAPVLDTIMISRTGATLMWPANGALGWMLEYGHKGFTPGTTTVYMLSNPYVNIGGLQPNSEYDVYLRTICGPNDTSDWSLNPIRFSTSCEQRTIPYVENFEGYYGSPYSAYMRALPTCWTLTGNTATKSQYNPQLYKDSTLALNGHHSLVFSAPATVSSPEIAASIDTLEAVFFMQVEDIADGLVFGVTDNPADNSTFVAIDTVFNTVADIYQRHTVVFNSYSGTGRHIAIRKLGTQSAPATKVFVDSLMVHPIPSCPSPAHVSSSNITAHTATIAWTERGTATRWILEYDTLGYTPGTGTQITVNSNPYVLTGLDSNRAYAVNVRSICTDTSDWANIGTEFLLPRCDDGCWYTLAMSSLSTGWYGASLEVKYNEHLTETVTLTSRSGVRNIYVCPDEPVAFTWQRGSSDGYCRFCILKDNDTLFSVNSAPTPGLIYTTTCGRDTTCPAPTNLTSTIVDYQTVNAGWYGTGIFEIICKKANSSEVLLRDTVSTQLYANTYRLDSLHPDTNYVWMIRKLCYADSISIWQIARFKIADNICVVPVDVEITAVNHNSAYVRWNSFANNRSWAVRCFSNAYNFDTVLYTTNHYTTVSGLYSGVEYFMSVMGLCADSTNSVWSDTLSFTTSVCDTVSGVTVSGITNTSATVSWTRGAGPSNWEVDYGFAGFPVNYGTIVASTSPTYNIGGLRPGTTYDVYVRTVCGVGFHSVWSAKVSFTTTGTSGIDQASADSTGIDIIPNPATKTTLVSAYGIVGKATLTITDISGKTIATYSMDCNGVLQKTIDVSDFAKGTYFVHVADDKASVVQKLVVQ